MGIAAGTARLSGRDDLPALAQLYRRGLAELGDERGGPLMALSEALVEPLETQLEARLDSSPDLVLVGEIDGVPVGIALARLQTLADGSLAGVVDALYVEPEARAVGVGEALLEQVAGWCAESGCIGIDAPALPGMRDSKNFFERSGFVARLLVMHRPLGGAARGHGRGSR